MLDFSLRIFSINFTIVSGIGIGEVGWWGIGGKGRGKGLVQRNSIDKYFTCFTHSKNTKDFKLFF